MGTIKIDTEAIKAASRSMKNQLYELDNALYDVQSLNWKLSEDVRRRRNIAGKIGSICAGIGEVRASCTRLAEVSVRCADEYARNEERIFQNAFFVGTEAAASLYPLSGSGQGGILSYNDMAFWTEEDKIQYELSVLRLMYGEEFVKVLNGTVNCTKEEIQVLAALLVWGNDEETWRALGTELSLEKHKIELTQYGLKYENAEGLTQYLLTGSLALNEELKSGYEMKGANDWLDDQFKDYKAEDKSYWYYDAQQDKYIPTDEKNGKIQNAEKLATMYEYSVGAEAAASIWKAEAEGKTDWGQGYAGVQVGNAEACAQASAGLYGVDKNGNKTISPGVGAHVGASVSGVSAQAQGQIGSDMLGLYGKAEASALKAGAEAEIGLGMVNGEFEAQAALGAEAILAEVSGEAGANVLGGEIGVQGTLNVGIGAKADVGYADGKIKAELGLSVGVGASVSLEIDVGGMAETICGEAASAINTAGEFFTDLWE